MPEQSGVVPDCRLPEVHSSFAIEAGVFEAEAQASCPAIEVEDLPLHSASPHTGTLRLPRFALVRWRLGSEILSRMSASSVIR